MKEQIWVVAISRAIRIWHIRAPGQNSGVSVQSLGRVGIHGICARRVEFNAYNIRKVLFLG